MSCAISNLIFKKNVDYSFMKKLLLCILLTGCTANGGNYANQKGNLIVYRPFSPFYINTFSMDINGQPTCDLHNGSFFITNIKNESTLSFSRWNLPGASRISAKPNSFIRVDLDTASMITGAVGSAIEQGLGKENGAFTLTEVTPDFAKKELKGLRQDCGN